MVESANVLILRLVIEARASLYLILILWLSGITACSSSLSSLPVPELSKQACEASGAFAHIPSGKFISGRNRTEQDAAYRMSAEAIATTPEGIAKAEQGLRKNRWFDRENNRQMQSLPAFCIARNLVTHQDYQKFVQATGHRSPGISAEDYQTQGFLVHPYQSVAQFHWQDNSFPPDKANHPVVLISYSDAVAYTEWKSRQDGAVYRLPQELEWEKAARGTEGQYFPWGNDWRADGTNWGGTGLDQTSPIGQFPLSRSVYGVEDMAGNVFEYTSTLRGNRVVMKGCSWDDLPGFCRAAYRHTRPAESRHILFGFRFIREK